MNKHSNEGFASQFIIQQMNKVSGKIIVERERALTFPIAYYSKIKYLKQNFKVHNITFIVSKFCTKNYYELHNGE